MRPLMQRFMCAPVQALPRQTLKSGGVLTRTCPREARLLYATRTFGTATKVEDMTPEQLEGVLARLGYDVPEQQKPVWLDIINATLPRYQLLSSLADPYEQQELIGDRSFQIADEAAQAAGWACTTNTALGGGGVLAGKSVVIKDSVAMGGVPMLNGSKIMQGYVPQADATIVQRLLRAGATITGKSHCENLCYSGGSHTNAFTSVRNPVNPKYSAGGSSSGSAALVASGAVDMAIGGDQGGSIRIPSSFCGTYGMKPTWGLVPYTGGMSMERTCDHLGPITNSVESNALMLSVLAGPDGLDSRQYSHPKDLKTNYHELMRLLDIKKMRIGVLSEGFSTAEKVEAVNDCVREACQVFSRLGAQVEEVSMPEHATGLAIWTGVFLEGSLENMVRSVPDMAAKGQHMPDLVSHYVSTRGARPNDFSVTAQLSFAIGEHVRKEFNSQFYAKGQNLSRALVKAYDDKLATYDVLIMPTTPMHATPLPADDADLVEVVTRAFQMIANTAPFDTTGHPAMSIPCGKVPSVYGAGDGDLPVGMMIVGKHFDEATIYAVASAFEQSQ